MKILYETAERGEVFRAPSLPLQEIETLITDHALWDARIVRCLAAGWALREDLRVVLPVIRAMDEARRECCSTLAERVDDEAAARLQTAGEEREFDKLLDVWEQELWEGSRTGPSEVPTFARYFAHQCVGFCRDNDTKTAIVFLFAVETVAVRICATLVEALRTANVKMTLSANPALRRHSLPVGENIFAARADREGFVDARNAVQYGLSLYLRLFEDLFQALRFERLSIAIDRIQARASLELESEPPIAMSPGVGEIMCEEQDDKRGIKFSVERYPCTAETLDPRVVRIPPGKTNNRHKHAHETLFYFITGTGRILVGEAWVPVKPGDAVFAPRWAIHQTHNTGDCELVLLAITDYYLTSRVYVGKYDKI